MLSWDYFFIRPHNKPIERPFVWPTEPHRRHLANTTEQSLCGGDAAHVKLLWPLVITAAVVACILKRHYRIPQQERSLVASAMLLVRHSDTGSQFFIPTLITVCFKIKIRYDTIRDVILTCARKLTWVSLIYRTEPTTKKCKHTETEKLKSNNGYAEK